MTIPIKHVMFLTSFEPKFKYLYLFSLTLNYFISKFGLDRMFLDRLLNILTMLMIS